MRIAKKIESLYRKSLNSYQFPSLQLRFASLKTPHKISGAMSVGQTRPKRRCLATMNSTVFCKNQTQDNMAMIPIHQQIFPIMTEKKSMYCNGPAKAKTSTHWKCCDHTSRELCINKCLQTWSTGHHCVCIVRGH